MKRLKARKLISWWVDFLIYFYAVILFFELFNHIVSNQEVTIQIILSVVLLIVIYISYSKKDILFKGRSLGKRVFNLAVYNELGTELVDNKVLKKRGNIECFTFPFDFWFILFLDKQIADYVCRTEVRDYKK